MQKISEEKGSKPVRVLTYNFFLRPPGFWNSWEGDFKEARIDDFAKNHFGDFDVICFQEVYSGLNSRQEKIIKLGKEYGFNYCSVPPKTKFKKQPNLIMLPIYGLLNISLQSAPLTNSGLLTISRYPISDIQFYSFNHAANDDYLAYKGVLYSQIEIDPLTEQKLHLFNTHLQAQYVSLKKDAKITDKDLEKGQYTLQARITQACDIRDFIEIIYKEKFITKNDNKNIVALCGDFNMDAKGDEIPSDYLIKFNPDFEKYREELEKNKNGPISFSEYDYIMDIISGGGADKIINLSFESYGEHQVTMGEIVTDKNGNKVGAENFLTWEGSRMDELCQDYCLIVQKDKGKDPRDFDEALERTIKSCKINRFKIENRRYTQLSDHYGLQYCLEMPKI